MLGEEVERPLPDFPARWRWAWVVGDVTELRLGARGYELSDWLGNVRLGVTDRRVAIRGNNQVVVGYWAEVVDVRDYYSYGLDISERSCGSPIHPYRYSFNGKEDLREQRWYRDYGTRFYHKALAQFMSADPLIVSQKKYAWLSSYPFASNSLVWAVDLDGPEMFVVHGTFQKEHGFSEALLSQLQRIAGNSEVAPSFSWGGGISFEKTRGEIAEELVDYIFHQRAAMSFHPESPAVNFGIKMHHHIVHEGDRVGVIAGGDKIYGTSSPRTKNYGISCSKSDLGWLGSHVKLPISHDWVKFLQGLPLMNGIGASDSSGSGSSTTKEKRE
jgi:RHS repeat-associated protein